MTIEIFALRHGCTQRLPVTPWDEWLDAIAIGNIFVWKEPIWFNCVGKNCAAMISSSEGRSRLIAGRLLGVNSLSHRFEIVASDDLEPVAGSVISRHWSDVGHGFFHAHLPVVAGTVADDSHAVLLHLRGGGWGERDRFVSLRHLPMHWFTRSEWINLDFKIKPNEQPIIASITGGREYFRGEQVAG